MIYQFKSNKQTFGGVDAQTVGDELERIRRANKGKLTTSEVLQWAAEPDSPIHDCFNWDDEQAAHEYRMQEARHLIKAVVVVVKRNDAPQPAFWNVSVAVSHSDTDEPTIERYYQSASVLAESPHEFNSALRIMLRELASAETSLGQLHRLAPKRKKTVIKRATGQVKSAHRELAELSPSK